MKPRNLAARALLLLPMLPVACSAGDDPGGGDGGTGMYGGSAGAQGYGGAMGTGTGAAGGMFGAAGTGNNGGTGAQAGTGGPGGTGGMGGGGGLGATGGIAGNGGTLGDGGTGNTGNTGGAGATTGSKDPIIPPVNGDVSRSSRTARSRSWAWAASESWRAQRLPAPRRRWSSTGTARARPPASSRAWPAAVQHGVVAEGGVLVSFQGTTGGDLLSGTNIFGAGDFDLADQLVACAVRNHNIDPRRIFATGCSAGGLFSAAMAARRSNYIAAAAPNSGGWVVSGHVAERLHAGADDDSRRARRRRGGRRLLEHQRDGGQCIQSQRRLRDQLQSRRRALRRRGSGPEHLGVLQGSPLRCRAQALVEFAGGVSQHVQDLLTGRGDNGAG